MEPMIQPKRTAEQRAEEEAVRRQHAAHPIRERPAGTINQQSFAAILGLVARLKAVRESQGLMLAEVAARMGIDPPALSRLETGKVLNPTLATLHKWAEALGQQLTIDFSGGNKAPRAEAKDFRLVDSGWEKELDEALRADGSSARIICPFIKRRAAERLLKHGVPTPLQVITRFHLGDFCDGVSDIAALRLLLENGALVRGVRNLHAKLYLFGDHRAIATSANLTEAGLRRNHEFGFVAEDAGVVGRCRQYFDALWERAGPNLVAERLAEWERKVTDRLVSGPRPVGATALPDEGVDAGISAEPTALPALVCDAGQAFVKFWGTDDNRADRSRPVLEELRRSGCHWACAYPKRPRQVQDGALMFMGRLVKEPNDILIFGRAVGVHHEPGRDDATDADVTLRPWKAQWPHYIRVHHPEFLAGTLSNGISLNELMEDLKSDAFAATQRHATKGEGNTDPRRAYRQQAAVELTDQAILWLNERLEQAFAKYGVLAPADLEQLDWPVVPERLRPANRQG
jgi:transcriptional regulator with XRE-family HTH domain